MQVRGNIPDAASFEATSADSGSLQSFSCGRSPTPPDTPCGQYVVAKGLRENKKFPRPQGVYPGPPIKPCMWGSKTVRKLHSYYCGEITDFLRQSVNEILGIINPNTVSSVITIEQSNTWRHKIEILPKQLPQFTSALHIFPSRRKTNGKETKNRPAYGDGQAAFRLKSLNKPHPSVPAPTGREGYQTVLRSRSFPGPFFPEEPRSAK